MNLAKPNDLPVILIGAMTPERVIGSGETMPWDIPEEYQTFVDSIRGRTVIMGRKSFEIFGPDLTSDHTIVISRSWQSDQVQVARSLDEALQLARDLKRDIFVAGGAEIYAQALPFADRMYLSEIKENHPGDHYFPAWDDQAWEIVREDNHAKFIYRQWKRIRANP